MPQELLFELNGIRITPHIATFGGTSYQVANVGSVTVSRRKKLNPVAVIIFLLGLGILGFRDSELPADGPRGRVRRRPDDPAHGLRARQPIRGDRTPHQRHVRAGGRGMPAGQAASCPDAQRHRRLPRALWRRHRRRPGRRAGPWTFRRVAGGTAGRVIATPLAIIRGTPPARRDVELRSEAKKCGVSAEDERPIEQ
jgi:hypothetical protein